MLERPDWTPPEEMIVRQPYLPRFMAGGETNPLGELYSEPAMPACRTTAPQRAISALRKSQSGMETASTGSKPLF